MNGHHILSLPFCDSLRTPDGHEPGEVNRSKFFLGSIKKTKWILSIKQFDFFIKYSGKDATR